MRDLMIDLETLSVGGIPALLSIGAVGFDINKGFKDTKIKTFYKNITYESNLKYKLDVSEETKEWWNQQTEAAKKALKSDQIPLKQALTEFSEWIKSNSYSTKGMELRVWSNGASFDIAILSNIYYVAKMEKPWSYRNEFDMRTILFLSGDDVKHKPAIEHHAMEDAFAQVKTLVHHYKRLALPHNWILSPFGKTICSRCRIDLDYTAPPYCEMP